MIGLVERLLQDFQEHANTCELEVCYNEKLCKVRRMEYLPDENGKVIFHKENKWSNDGYSITEVLEFLKKYKEEITDVLFEAYDGTYQKYLNTYEIMADTSGTLYRVRILVGEDGPLKLPDNYVPKGNASITIV